MRVELTCNMFIHAGSMLNFPAAIPYHADVSSYEAVGYAQTVVEKRMRVANVFHAPHPQETKLNMGDYKAMRHR